MKNFKTLIIVILAANFLFFSCEDESENPEILEENTINDSTVIAKRGRRAKRPAKIYIYDFDSENGRYFFSINAKSGPSRENHHIKIYTDGDHTLEFGPATKKDKYYEIKIWEHVGAINFHFVAFVQRQTWRFNGHLYVDYDKENKIFVKR